MFNLLNDDLDYLDSEKDFGDRQVSHNTGNKRRQQLVRAVLDDESSL